MLIIQRITTEWTKSSRGGDGAIKRNTVPDGVLLPAFPQLDGKYCLHDVRYLESEGFHPVDSFAESDLQGHIHIGPFTIRVSRDHIESLFAWSWHECRAPERQSHRLFDLLLGQWGRFKCNGRFGAQSSSGREWGYHKSVFNVAFVESFDIDIFVNSNPDFTESQMAVLR